MAHNVIDISQWKQNAALKRERDELLRIGRDISLVAEELVDGVDYLSEKYGPGETIGGLLDVVYSLVQESCHNISQAPDRMRDLMEYTIIVLEKRRHRAELQ